jgi:hypothetical protein
MSDEEDKIKSSAKLEVHEWKIDELHRGVKELQTEVRGYRKENQETARILDEHVVSCNDRYKELRADKAGGTEAFEKKLPFYVRWLLNYANRLPEKAIDWVLLVIVLACWFAYNHGFIPPPPVSP